MLPKFQQKICTSVLVDALKHILTVTDSYEWKKPHPCAFLYCHVLLNNVLFKICFILMHVVSSFR